MRCFRSFPRRPVPAIRDGQTAAQALESFDEIFADLRACTTVEAFGTAVKRALGRDRANLLVALQNLTFESTEECPAALGALLLLRGEGENLLALTPQEIAEVLAWDSRAFHLLRGGVCIRGMEIDMAPLILQAETRGALELLVGRVNPEDLWFMEFGLPVSDDPALTAYGWGYCRLFRKCMLLDRRFVDLALAELDRLATQIRAHRVRAWRLDTEMIHFVELVARLDGRALRKSGLVEAMVPHWTATQLKIVLLALGPDGSLDLPRYTIKRPRETDSAEPEARRACPSD